MQYASDTFLKAMFRRYISKWNSYLVYLCADGCMQRILQERCLTVYSAVKRQRLLGLDFLFTGSGVPCGGGVG